MILTAALAGILKLSAVTLAYTRISAHLCIAAYNVY